MNARRPPSSTLRFLPRPALPCLILALLFSGAPPASLPAWAQSSVISITLRAEPGDGAAVSPDSLVSTVRWLADDAREGRMTGSPGAAAAADWIAERFASAGLAPGSDGDYLQRYDATIGARLGAGNSLAFEGVEGLGALRVEKDYIPLGFSENDTVEAPMVFAGYGITAKDLDYDDYAGLDAKGKVVLVLRHEPQQNDTASVFAGASWTDHAIFRNKAVNARDHGALALLLVTPPGSAGYEEDALTRLSGDEGIGGGSLPAVHLKREAGEALLRKLGVDAAQWVQEVDADLKPRSAAFPTEVIARLAVTVEKDRRPASNVVGLLRGRDPGAGAVILGAHYDHLGRGNSSSLAPDRLGEVHNGADDNASGVAALVELARVFAAGPLPRRTLVFAAFSGEELGILGSSHFASHPPVPLDSVQAMINMDMVGRPKDGKITVGGVGSSPGFAEEVKRAGEAVGLGVSTSKSGYGASDHTAFYTRGVPVLFFFSGLHEDYHKPSDDWEKIDREGIAGVTRMVQAVARELAEREDRVAFVKVAEDSSAGHGRGAGAGYGAYLGTIPDFGDYEGGAKLSGVKAGSPAEAAGIRGGDVIVRFGGREVKDLHGYTYALREHKPGDKVAIELLRGEERITVEATLGRRD